MFITRSVVGLFSISLMALAANVACGLEYPNKPIRILAGEPGGGVEIVARVIAQGISGPLGQPVIIDNRPTNINAEYAARSTPDGYTLLGAGNNVWLVPLIQKAPYNVVKDFSPITLAVRSPTFLVVHPSSPAKSVKELIDLAKAKPGTLNYARSGIGGTPHLSAELFRAMAGVNIVGVNYKGGGLALNALIGGEVDLNFASAGTVMAHLKSGRLRALAVTTAQPSALFPEVPTVAASGLPGYESISFIGMFAPATTPAAVVTRLNHEIVRFLNRTEVKDNFANVGVEIIGSSPHEFAAMLRSEIAKWGKVIKNAGIRIE